MLFFSHAEISLGLFVFQVSCCKRLVMLARYPPAQAGLPVVKRPEGKGPAPCLEARGSVSGGCPAGAAARAAWWGESRAKRERGGSLPRGARPSAGTEGEHGRAEPEREVRHRPPAGSPRGVGQPPACGTGAGGGCSRLGGLPPFYFSGGAPLFGGAPTYVNGIIKVAVFLVLCLFWGG